MADVSAAEQADSMVDSLQKAINQCAVGQSFTSANEVQEFIIAVESGSRSSQVSSEALEAIEKSYAAKKK